MVGWSGKKLKLGVNNKEDYAILVATDKWPTRVNGIDIIVQKPKFSPDSFVLFVRYVPRERDESFVAGEIQRTIASADRIKRIHYAYQRKTNDFRFDVKDYQEYNAALQLGRIAIGHSWLSITQFFPGNRLTYCTKCWCLDHLKNRCDAATRCRVCLDTLNDGSTHICKNKRKCAQCGGNHHSLDYQCQVIQDYKHRLKEDVEEAIKSGKLHRFQPKEQSPSFKLMEKNFPALKADDNHSLKKWNTVQARTTNQWNTMKVLEADKSFDGINKKLSELLDSNKRVENKVDQLKADSKIVTLNTQLHQAVLIDIITIMKDFSQQFVSPSLTSSRLDRMPLIPVAQEFYNRFHIASISLNDGFQLNRKVVVASSADDCVVLHSNQCSPLLSNTIDKSISNKPKSSNTRNAK